jgi:hypothetical protein
MRIVVEQALPAERSVTSPGDRELPGFQPADACAVMIVSGINGWGNSQETALERQAKVAVCGNYVRLPRRQVGENRGGACLCGTPMFATGSTRNYFPGSIEF